MLKLASRRAARGFTLVEVLVALLVLAFGLLGAASLQTFAMRNTHSADSRSVALYLAYDIIDRIHANAYSCTQGSAHPAAGSSGFPGDCYDLVSTPASYNNFSASPPASTCFGSSVTCTPAQLAAADLWSWQQNVAAQLPGGEGVVCNDNTPADGQPSWANGGAHSALAYACDGAAVAATACASCGANAPVLTVKIWWNDRIANSQAGSSLAADSSFTSRRLYLSFQP